MPADPRIKLLTLLGGTGILVGGLLVAWLILEGSDISKNQTEEPPAPVEPSPPPEPGALEVEVDWLLDQGLLQLGATPLIDGSGTDRVSVWVYRTVGNTRQGVADQLVILTLETGADGYFHSEFSNHRPPSPPLKFSYGQKVRALNLRTDSQGFVLVGIYGDPKGSDDLRVSVPPLGSSIHTIDSRGF